MNGLFACLKQWLVRGIASCCWAIDLFATVLKQANFPVLSTGHIYLSQSHPIAIYACPIPSHGTFPMGFPLEWHSHGQACNFRSVSICAKWAEDYCCLVTAFFYIFVTLVGINNSVYSFNCICLSGPTRLKSMVFVDVAKLYTSCTSMTSLFIFHRLCVCCVICFVDLRTSALPR